eukprot:NODE_125_length_17255_cov_0.877827.p7 type:complete len:243 gc:universal NODE_125_length_17255_cov_0.877827:16870-16142(-)
MRFRAAVDNAIFQKSIDHLIKNTSAQESIYFLFTEDCSIFYTEAMFGQISVFNSIDLSSKHIYKDAQCIGIQIKQPVLQKMAAKFKPFDTFELILVKGPKLKCFYNQYTFTCEVDLLHPTTFRDESEFPECLKFKLPDLRNYTTVLSTLGNQVKISVGNCLKLEQSEPESQTTISLPIEIIELHQDNSAIITATVLSSALARLFKSPIENSIGCLSEDFFGLCVDLPNHGWLLISLDTIAAV